MEKYEKSSSIESAGRKVRERFPFPEFIGGALKTTTTIVETAQKYLVPGSRILDFGCGACDKTAVVQTVGYRCSGFDDLADEWHLIDGNRGKILQFAHEFGIDFRLASDGYLPFQKESFDMVMAHDVLEHLHDSPRELLNDLVELIRPNGFLFITVPNAREHSKATIFARWQDEFASFWHILLVPGAVARTYSRICEG